MSGYITTYTGKHFWPCDPDPEKLCIEDVAHSLSLICRGNGHVSTFFSVGQHCLLCAREALARGYGNRVALACLLHDASEGYLTDLPRPIKAVMPKYREIEERLLGVIYETFLGQGLSKEEEALVKEVDDALLWYDMKELLGEEMEGEPPLVHVLLDYGFRPFAEVEQEYLSFYEKLRGRKMVPASLPALTEALITCTDGFESYYGRYTGELIRMPARGNVILEATPEEEEIRRKAQAGEEYVLLPGPQELGEQEVMAAFLEEVLYPRDMMYLRSCLEKSHPIRHFREGLEETGHMAEYEDFLRTAYRRKAREWCEKEKLPFA